MKAMSRWAFISLSMVTQATLANGFPSESAKIFATTPTDIVTTQWQSSPIPVAPAVPEVKQTTGVPGCANQAPAGPGPQIPQITVDLATQKAKIWYVGQAEPIEVNVSTGGTLKKPDGNDRLQDGNLNPYQIYCGHWESRRAKGGVAAVPFTGSMEEEGSRDENFTTYRKYVSGAFDNGDGTGGVAMPYAIRVPREIQEAMTGVIEDRSTRPITTIDCSKVPDNRRCSPRAGIFIHERPGTQYAKDHLGQPVSGGCIRLPRQEDMPVLPGLGKIAPAKMLWEQTNKYCGINIEIVNNPPPEAEKSCNQRIVNAARDEVNATRLARDRDFGRKFYCYWNEEACRQEDIRTAAQQRETARAAQLAKEAAGRN